MNILKNKVFLLIITIIIIGIVFISFIKVININKQNCNSDADCTYYVPSCCSYCGSGFELVNKKSLTTLKIEKSINCLFGLISLPCNRWGTIADCIPNIGSEELFCNQNNKCDSRINCEKTCETYSTEIQTYPDRKEKVREMILKETECVCTFE